MPTLKPTKETENSRTLDRVFKIVATLHAELQSLEESVDLQLQDSVRATEARLKALAAEEQQEMVRETEAAVRQQVSKDLLDRFGFEMEILKAEHAQQLSAEIQELKAALENEKDTSVAAAKSESEARVKDLEAEAAEWTVEREQLQAQVAEAIRPQGMKFPGS